MSGDAQFTPEERAIMAELDEAEGMTPEADTNEGATTADDSTQASEASGQTQAEGGQGEKTTTEDKAEGNLAIALKQDREQLRAARRAERQAQQEAARLRAELEEARKAIPKTKAPIDSVVEQIEEDLPEVAQAFRALRSEVEELRGKPKQDDAPAFVPAVLPPDVQSAVDQSDDLADWQMNPDQTMWDLAVKADEFLRTSPKWATKPMSERLAEAARIAREQASDDTQTTGAPAPQDPKAKAREVIDKTPRTSPLTLGDLRGGASPKASGPNYNDMTDDQIMASL